MHKAELINRISEEAGISKAAAARVIDALTEAVTAALKEGDQVALVGFGTFSVRQRSARTGRNPQTGQNIEIASAKIPSFKASPKLKLNVDDDGHG
ncbi:MAG: HU family DNA-binding protein [Idiomarina sp.]|nr:HU family DNA-binding protein [Idiomarina sp.]